jgi:(p)ppGpp synthase/HD superfamily hydrolase
MELNDPRALAEKAQAFAIAAHARQRYCNGPYRNHLEDVIAVLQSCGAAFEDAFSAPILVAAWLHDTLGEAATDRASLASEFGPEIARLVWRVTDERDGTVAERHTRTWLKLRDDERAIVLKLADRIANVEACLRTKPQKLDKYRHEHRGFTTAVRPYCRSAMAVRMWEKLDEMLSEEQ